MIVGACQWGGKDYRRLDLVVTDLIRKGKLGEDDFIGSFVEGIRK